MLSLKTVNKGKERSESKRTVFLSSNEWLLSSLYTIRIYQIWWRDNEPLLGPILFPHSCSFSQYQILPQFSFGVYSVSGFCPRGEVTPKAPSASQYPCSHWYMGKANSTEFYGGYKQWVEDSDFWVYCQDFRVGPL